MLPAQNPEPSLPHSYNPVLKRMNLLKIIFRSPRPAAVNDMRAEVSRLWRRKGYTAMTVFGRIFTSEQAVADHLNRRNDALKNHEMIHLRQAQSTGNSWFRFYFLYFWHSLLALRYWRKVKNAVYYLNPFEMEAYAHQHDLHYLDRCGDRGASEWRTFARMKLSQRKDFIESHCIGQ